MGFLVSISTIGINSKSVHFGLYSPYKKPPHFQQCPMWVDNMADNADITQMQAANHHQLLSHVTLGVVECRK